MMCPRRPRRRGPTYLNAATVCTTFWLVLFFVVGPDIFGDSEGVAVNKLSDLMRKSGQVGSCKEECKRVNMDHFDPASVIRILSWTPLSPYYKGPWYPEGSGIFDSCGFDPPLKCEYTHDRSMLHVSDGVLFRAMVLNEHPPPDLHQAHQKWVFFEVKPPRLMSILQNLTDYRDRFNITSTYTRDSDVPIPFMRKCIPMHGQTNVPAYHQENFAGKKSRLVAWVNVNHCQTVSRREHYVKRLQQHLQVDIYGQCGSYRCDTKWDFAKCLSKVSAKYKFLLAFENVLCSDYITDILWAVFDHKLKIVPVVLGASDYSTVLPAGTFIDVRNWTSPRALASYLKHLDRDDELYNAYIRRRRFDKCHYTTEYSQYHCALCQHLHLYRGVAEVALDVHHFWHSQHRCQSPKAFYTGIADDIFSDDAPAKAWDPS